MVNARLRLFTQNAVLKNLAEMMMTLETNYFSKGNRNIDIYEQIALAVNGIRFGSVEIIIHDGKVVQIERKEKLRFEGRSALNTKS